jgi:hypothetical protein
MSILHRLSILATLSHSRDHDLRSLPWLSVLSVNVPQKVPIWRQLLSVKTLSLHNLGSRYQNGGLTGDGPIHGGLLGAQMDNLILLNLLVLLLLYNSRVYGLLRLIKYFAIITCSRE